MKRHFGSAAAPVMLVLVVSASVTRINEFGLSSTLDIWKNSLGINYAEAGFAISVVFVGACVASFFCSGILNRFGAKNSYTLCLALSTAGFLLYYCVRTYAALLAARIVFSLGLGLSIGVMAAGAKQWFSARQLVVFNVLNSLIPSIGQLIGLVSIVPLTNLLGKWNAAMGVYGFLLLSMTAIWCAMRPRAAISPEPSAKEGVNQSAWAIFLEAWRYAETKFLCLAMFFSMANRSVFNSYYPQYCALLPGSDMETASQVTAISPLFAVLGALAAMFFILRMGSRKKVSALGGILVITGFEMAVFFVGKPLGYVGTAIFGFGMSFRTPAIYQIAMELPRANPHVTGMVYGLMGASLFLAASIMPALVGAVIDAVGGLSLSALRIVIALSGITTLLSMACVALCPTGRIALKPTPRRQEAQGA